MHNKNIFYFLFYICIIYKYMNIYIEINIYIYIEINMETNIFCKKKLLTGGSTKWESQSNVS